MSKSASKGRFYQRMGTSAGRHEPRRARRERVRGGAARRRAGARHAEVQRDERDRRIIQPSLVSETIKYFLTLFSTFCHFLILFGTF